MPTVTIRPATSCDFTTIQQIAHTTWPVTFGGILSPAQIQYMLERMYSIASLQEQTQQQGHVFLLAEREDTGLGYVSYEIGYKGPSIVKIHKLYVLPLAQGAGVGKQLIDRVAALAWEQDCDRLRLDVNRDNPAVGFYQRLGFTILGNQDTPIGGGFVMEDYVMEKPIGV